MRLGKISLTAAAVLAASAMIGVPSVAEAAPVAKAAPAAQPTESCVESDDPEANVYCIYMGTNGTGTYMVTQLSLGDLMLFRNADESVDNPIGLNNNKMYLRLYYSPNYAGSWVCMNPGFIPNTSAYAFNNGPSLGGYGTSIWKNVASATLTGTACGNPIN